MKTENDGQALASLLAGIVLVDPMYDRQIHSIASDSRRVQKGGLFLAYPGQSSDARTFIPQAIAQGAVAVLAEGEMGVDVQNEVPIFSAPKIQSCLAKIAARFYGYPSRKMIITGITGTNGKTSISHFIAHAYSYLATPCAILGTIGNGLPGQLQTSTHTTPDPLFLQAQLSAWLGEHIKHVAMEVSSHALDQNRVNHTEFTTAIFSNLTHDHLDYHGDFASYGAAKRKLFTTFGLKHAVLNRDDPYTDTIRSAIANDVKVITYGFTDKADVYATHIQLLPTGMLFVCHSPWGASELRVSLYGQFNIANLLAALSALCLQGVKWGDAILALNKMTGVPGRMQVMHHVGKPTAVIDYAHTPDALEKALVAVRAHCQGKLWCVFGCGGDRDASKRPLMAGIAENGADHVIVTSDNPRTESSSAIVADIMRGFTNPARVHIEQDRKQAILMTLEQASEEDVVLIAGKGHENYQIIGAIRTHFSDSEVVADHFAA